MATTPTNLPITSEDPRDLKFNAGKFDEVMTSDAHYYTDRFGVKRFTISGFQYTAEEAIRNYGYITMDSFEDGAALTLPNQVLRYEATGEYYRWDGELPKTVPAGSTPASTGGVGLGAWLSVGDAALRNNLSLVDGYHLIGSASYSDIRGYSGSASVIYCHGISNIFDAGSGYFYLDNSDTTSLDNGGTILVDSNGGRWKRKIVNNVILAEWFGVKADWDGTTGTDNAMPMQKALAAVPASSGELVFPAGNIMYTQMFSINRSNITVRGAGNRVTHFVPHTIASKAAMEVNNGSWDYSTNTYTLSGSSFGHTILRDFSMDGTSTTGSTGIVFARATLGCRLESLTIENFSVGHRAYGSWYSRMQNVILANNGVNMYMDYATNDWSAIACEFISTPGSAVATQAHFESQGNGTNIAVSFVGCSFDGLPEQFGCYFKGIYNLSFSGATYAEVYPSDTNLNSPFFLFGKTSVGVDFSGVHMTAGTDYAGTFVKCGTENDGNDIGVNTMKIDSCFLYKSGANTCKSVDTQFGTNIEFGVNRFEGPLVIPNQHAVVSSVQTSTFIPSVTGTSDIKIPVAIIRKTFSIPVVRISVKFLSNATISGSQFIRIVDNNDNVIVNYPFTGTVTAGTTVNLTDIAADGYVTTTGKASINSVMAKGSVLNLWTYKNGGSSDWPMMSVIVEHV